MVQDAGAGVSHCTMALVRVPSGTSASTMSGTNGATPYSPIREAIWIGKFNSKAGLHGELVSGETKAMRKFVVGDTFQFIALNEATDTVDLYGVIQFFLKT